MQRHVILAAVQAVVQALLVAPKRAAATPPPSLAPTRTSTAPNAAPSSDRNAQRILTNFAKFDADVACAQAALARGELETAAFYAATAATVATHNHCGIFASPRLERLLHEISDRVPQPDGDRLPRATREPVRTVLHVATELPPVGGLTRLIARWITVDAARSHSLVLTSQRDEVPPYLSQAVSARNGRVHRLNRKMGNLLDWVGDLRRLARDFDLVILHGNCEDVIPLIAFASGASPPVLVLNHADHIFWLGSSVGRMVINLRDAATEITVGRRGVEPRRNFLLPTIVEQTVRTRSRREAKAELGVPADDVLLVSVARGAKYRALSGTSYADMHAGVLERHPNARLLVVGPGEPDDWAAAKARFGDRLIGLPQTNDPSLYFEAADIYVDSYPFVSSTSMMEAGGFGTPLVTLFTYPEAARIFGINHVGLVGTALQAASPSEYEEILERLIVDPEFREASGVAVREAIEAAHVAPGVLTYLEDLYAAAQDLPPSVNEGARMDADIEVPRLGLPDSLHEDIFGYDYARSEIRKIYMGALPLGQRLALWRQMRGSGEIQGPAESLKMLAPEWFKRRLTS